MVIMHVLGLSIDSVAKTPIVLLQADREEKVLPIWVGALEAMHISVALNGQKMPRPSTHDLFHSVLNALNAYIEGVEVYDFIDGTFHVNMLVRHQEAMHRIDCRPADGIALALKICAPIVVHRHVLAAAHNAEQKKDAIASQLLNPLNSLAINEETGNMLPSAQILTKVTKHVINDLPTTLGIINKTSHDEDEFTAKEDKNLAKLLLRLEPMSSRKM